MDYLSVYNTLINSGLNRHPFPGCHKHRIIPGYKKGKYEEFNISLLTRQEHRIVHQLRFKLWKDTRDAHAVVALDGNLQFEVSEAFRKNLSKFRKSQPGLFTGRQHSLETKVKMSAAKIGKPRSQETRDKIRASLKARNKGAIPVD